MSTILYLLTVAERAAQRENRGASLTTQIGRGPRVGLIGVSCDRPSHHVIHWWRQETYGSASTMFMHARVDLRSAATMSPSWDQAWAPAVDTQNVLVCRETPLRASTGWRPTGLEYE